MRAWAVRALVAVLWIASVSPAAAAVAIVQNPAISGYTTLDTGGDNFSFGGATTSGNTVVVTIDAGADVTCSVADATNGAYTEAVGSNGSSPGLDYVGVHHFRNAASITTVTVTCTGTATFSRVKLYELSGVDNAAAIPTDENVEASAVTTHQCGASGVSGTGFVVCAGTMSSTRTATAGTGYTLDSITGSDTEAVVERQIGTFSGEIPDYTSSSTTGSRNVSALFPEASASPGWRGCSPLGLGIC